MFNQKYSVNIGRYLMRQMSLLNCSTCSTRCWSRRLVKGLHQINTSTHLLSSVTCQLLAVSHFTEWSPLPSFQSCFSLFSSCEFLPTKRFFSSLAPDCKRLALSRDHFLSALTSVWLGIWHLTSVWLGTIISEILFTRQQAQ